ncbi:serine/threonine protein kinase [Leeia oryzae]|uniref:serine/threonine protein kinase n=1 Tax=Leeia oryzae TaxID=356662 RepID=UPI00036D6C89|nr:serine/threonine protein kinase [Leeia oryzae]
MAEHIGRFERVRELGHGAQGTVFLANDPVLGRQVALKQMRIAGANEQQRAALLNEARVVSKLQHPNIVQLFDVVEHQQQHVLVFEFVDGLTLKDWLVQHHQMEAGQAASVLRDVLSGLCAAHDQGILHRDIKPANVMLDKEDRARLMDFGIAVPANAKGQPEVSGTLQYMAPEYVAGRPAGVNADLFSVGVLGYELLTGKNPFEGSNHFEVLNRIANVPVSPPSQLIASVPVALEHVIMVALNKDAGERYQTAAEMLAAIEQYLAPGESGQDSSGSATIDFLLRRLKHSQDFPVLSQSVSSINKLVAADAESIHRLAETILHDFSLTNKLLRLVNSAVYGQFGGTISTISRAVLILGFETVRNLAIGLIVFEHLQNRNQAVNLKDLMLGSFLSGLIARKVSKKVGLRGVEESFIGGMFYHMGKLLTAYYLNEEFQEITRRVQQGMPENQAASQVLGVEFSALGIGVAREWRFPDKLLNAIMPYHGKVPALKSDADRTRLTANFAGELAQLAMGTQVADRDKRLAELTQKYGEASGISSNDQITFLQDGLKDLVAEAHYFGLDASKGQLLTKMKQFAGMASAAPATAASSAPMDTLERVSHAFQEAEVQAMTQDKPDAEGILSAGVQDITNTLVSDFKLNDLINMILEAMYRGVGFRRVLFCMRDVRKNQLVARFGYGEGIPEMKQFFVVPLDGVHDVFQLSLNKNLDVQIDDVSTGSLADRVPAWFNTHVKAKAFVVLPVVIDKKVIGMFYGDQPDANTLNLSPKSLTLLKTLRNQAVLGIRQRQG